MNRYTFIEGNLPREQFKKIRKDLDLTYSDVAKLTGFSQLYIGNFERGKIKSSDIFCKKFIEVSEKLKLAKEIKEKILKLGDDHE